MANMIRNWRGGPGGLEYVDKETFERNQTISIRKAINHNETPAKEKHVRNAILGTYQEKGANTFWHIVRRLQLSTDAITCWKFLHVLHKLLRDGHESTLQCSLRYKPQLKELGSIWTHAPQGYGRLILKYTAFLVQRMNFHKKFAEFPGNLSVSNETLENVGKNDINLFFELCVDMLDCLDNLMELQQSVFNMLDFSRAVSMTDAGQCRLAPCILVILDSSQLYDYSVKILFKLHACLPADTLTGHRERFIGIYNKLKTFYYTCSNMQYFKRLIQVPLMSDKPPDFLLKLEKGDQLGPVRMIQEAQVDRSPSPEPEPEPVTNTLADTNFDAVFGASNAMDTFTFYEEPDPRDELIKQLRAEIEKLKSDIALMQSEHHREVQQLLDRISELEKVLMEKNVQMQTQMERSEQLNHQLALALEEAGKATAAHGLVADIEKKALANEEMYKRMKEKHMNLVKEHAELLRKNANAVKETSSMQMSVETMETERLNLQKIADDLQKRLGNKENEVYAERKSKEQDLHNFFVKSIEETELMIKEAIDEINDSVTGQSTCSAESLLKTIHSTMTALDNLQIKSDRYITEKITPELNVDVIHALSKFGHWLSQTLLNANATCHLVNADEGQALEDSWKDCGSETLAFLKELKEYQGYILKNEKSINNKVSDKLARLSNIAKDLLPKMTDIMGGDLQDFVDQEMAATTEAIENAAARIEAMLQEAKERDTGINLEVNERILDSCTELMRMIRALIVAAKDLQKEIVQDGRGASSVKEFYMKNSRWTEGLISAAKAVGWAATMLTDGADQVVTGTGKFEELIVCSHEIAASTAQLVAASRVKANKRSPKLGKLQSASKDVNGAAGRVIASTNLGKEQSSEDSDKLMNDLSKTTLIQIKRKEMDSQVHILELEQALKEERVKLGKFRKQHYLLVGVDEDSENAGSPNENKNNNNNHQVKQGNAPNESPIPAVNVVKQKPPLPLKPNHLNS